MSWGSAHIHIILLTAKGQEFDRQRGQEVGADLYMTKPFDPDALIAKARSVLGIAAAGNLRHMAALTLRALLNPKNGSSLSSRLSARLPATACAFLMHRASSSWEMSLTATFAAILDRAG